jgi:hypothetical protein
MTSAKTRLLRVSYLHGGKRESVEVEVPDSGEPDEQLVEEAARFVQTLEDNHQLAPAAGAMPPGATHQIETRPDGTKRLIRRRFTLG